MDKRELYKSLNEIERHLQSLMIQVQSMKTELTDIVENLEIENQHVRDRLQELEQSNEGEDTSARRLKSQQALEKLYEEGYHVCAERYGARLDKDEDSCMFCLNIIDGMNRD